ncbi:MAG TPA: hypothetical protein PLB97_01235 [Accumulibacter sp.]|nr:hypothetical protein [Accumulibacter sp.]HPP46366.1 hypothetical protein [Accumulibacter sp.]
MAQNPFGTNGRLPVYLGVTPPIVGVPAWEKTASRATRQAAHHQRLPHQTRNQALNPRGRRHEKVVPLRHLIVPQGYPL